MSDATVSAVEPAIALDPSTSKPSAPALAKAEKGEADADPSWVGARLERERAKFLKDLGVDSIDAAKAAIAANKAKEDAEKTIAQKAADFEASWKSEKAAKDAIAAELSAYAQSAMGALTETQRAAVAAVAGDDPAKQLSTIRALTPTWASAAAPAAKVADTAPAPAAPKDGGGAVSPPDLKAVYAEMLKTNPIVAARFAVENRLFETK